MVITCHTMGLILLDRGDRSVERCLGISRKHSHWLGTVAGCLTCYISFSIHSSSSLGVRTGSQVPDKEADLALVALPRSWKNQVRNYSLYQYNLKPRSLPHEPIRYRDNYLKQFMDYGSNVFHAKSTEVYRMRNLLSIIPFLIDIPS